LNKHILDHIVALTATVKYY